MTLPCTGLTSVFFPDEGGSYDQARAICAGCSLREKCLSQNIHERFGMFGGASPQERRAMLGYRVRSLRAAALANRLRYHSAA